MQKEIKLGHEIYECIVYDMKTIEIVVSTIGRIAFLQKKLAWKPGIISCKSDNLADKQTTEKIIIAPYPHSPPSPILKKSHATGNAIKLNPPTTIWYFFILPVASIAV